MLLCEKTRNIERFQKLQFDVSFLKNKNNFQKTVELFLVESTNIEN